MGKSIINKHKDSFNEIDRSLFNSNENLAKGEVVICNDKENPSLCVLTYNGEVAQIGNYDDTELRDLINDKSLTLTDDITVAGLDETEQFGSGTYKNGSKIEKGTSIEVILRNILCQEKYPEPKTTQADMQVSMNDLTITLNNDENPIEVGTLVKISEVKTDGVNTTTQNSEISGMKYGYSNSDNDTQEYIDDSIQSNIQYTPYNNVYTIESVSVSGFNSSDQHKIDTSIFPKFDSENVTINDIELGCISEGENIITLHATGPNYKYSAEKIDKIYYCSNLNKTDEGHTREVDKVDKETSSPEKYQEKKLEGRYKYFLGYVDTSESNFEFTSDIIRDLTSGWITQDGITKIGDDNSVKSDGNSIVIACPEKYKLNTITNSIGASIIDLFEQSSIDIKTGEIMTTYNVYVYKITNGAAVEFKNVSLSLQ